MKESEIRSRNAMDRYLALVREDCRRLVSEEGTVPGSACPACAGEASTLQFVKDGFEYATCDACGTLFARTRLAFEALQRFYEHSVSTRFWIDEFFRPVAEARREKIFRPRAEYVARHFGDDPGWTIGDIGAGWGLFSQELRALWPRSRYVAIEPSPEQAEICRAAGLDVICAPLESVSGREGQFDLLTAFELLEHLYDPAAFLRAAARLLRPGGWLLLTSLNGEGFDIQILWERSRNIYPPCHLNFLNPRSLAILLGRAGFAAAEISTPGRLDWNIVEGHVEQEPDSAGRLWDLVARTASPEAKAELQDWIRRHQFSSHMQALARRAGPEGAASSRSHS